MSPDDYRRLRGSGGRPSRHAPSGGRPGPVQAYDVIDLNSATGLPEFMRGGLGNAAGRPVTERSAMRNATFNRAVTVTASTIGMLPLNLHRRARDGTIEKASDHPVARLLRDKPNAAQTPRAFKSYMQGRALLKGNAYAFKVPGVNGPQALWPLDPDRVAIKQAEDFSLAYHYQPKTGGKRIFSANEIFHLRAPWSCDGILGEGLLSLSAEALGLAGLADDAAARMMRNGAYVGGVLQHPKTLGYEGALSLRKQFEERFVGPENAGRWVVAEEGMEVKPFGATGRDAEGIAQRKLQAEEISRFTGVPRPLLMFDETSWGSGIEQLGLFFVTYCLLPWFNAWEEEIGRSLLNDRDRETHYAKFNEAALLRGSLKDQAEFLSKALGGPGAGGFMVPNEARDKMDMNPEPWGDTPAWQQGASNAQST